MQTICVLNGRVMLSQSGEHLATMRKNAEQYSGAVASVVTDEEYVTLSNPPLTLEQVKTKQIATLGAAYNAAIQLPVSYMATTFQADTASQDILTKCLVAGSVPTGFYWLDVNNVQVPMTFAQLQGLAGVMLVQGQVAFTKLQTKKAAVREALTVADVQAVVW